MKNLEVVRKENVEHLLSGIWQTDIFKCLSQTHPYFKALSKRLSSGHIAFYEATTSKQKNHLTSHARLIAKREYENKYVQDLYYLHELTHAAHFDVKRVFVFGLPNALSENELFASMMSEAFIYFFAPELMGKTFNPLWAENFKANLNPSLHERVACFSEEEWFIFGEHWPGVFQEAIARRLALREGVQPQWPGEDVIVNYNSKREPWLLRWSGAWPAVVDVSCGAFEDTPDIWLKKIEKHTNDEGICFTLDKKLVI
jgi:hypothetical protein